jgi:hypothetical protein
MGEISRLRRVPKRCRGLQQSRTLRAGDGHMECGSPLPLLSPRRSRDPRTSPTFNHTRIGWTDDKSPDSLYPKKENGPASTVRVTGGLSRIGELVPKDICGNGPSDLASLKPGIVALMSLSLAELSGRSRGIESSSSSFSPTRIQNIKHPTKGTSRSKSRDGRNER